MLTFVLAVLLFGLSAYLILPFGLAIFTTGVVVAGGLVTYAAGKYDRRRSHTLRRSQTLRR